VPLKAPFPLLSQATRAHIAAGSAGKLENNKLQSCVPMSQEEFEKFQEIEALKKKFQK
jgi:hypothetical protein